MKYRFHTVSKPLSGSEADKLAQAIQSGGHLANEIALTLMKKIADRRCQKLRMPPNRKFAEVDSSKISLEQAISELSGLGQGFRFLQGEFFTQMLVGVI